MGPCKHGFMKARICKPGCADMSLRKETRYAIRRLGSSTWAQASPAQPVTCDCHCSRSATSRSFSDTLPLPTLPTPPLPPVDVRRVSRRCTVPAAPLPLRECPADACTDGGAERRKDWASHAPASMVSGAVSAAGRSNGGDASTAGRPPATGTVAATATGSCWAAALPRSFGSTAAAVPASEPTRRSSGASTQARLSASTPARGCRRGAAAATAEPETHSCVGEGEVGCAAGAFGR
eukprot:358514-Chlamydomonas_euryale.AAC.9